MKREIGILETFVALLEVATNMCIKIKYFLTLTVWKRIAAIRIT